MLNFPKWVVLAYLNGNNELEPEMAAAKHDLEKTAIENDIVILLQIGRLDQSAVEILRPDNNDPDPNDIWSGVRRYCISKSGSTLLEELGNQNMADPQCLYYFLRWGIQNYPSAHYMLILGGHSCEYIGMMNDYSQDRPYIMGIPELSLVIEYTQKTVGRSIDLLIFDTCLFNNIELLYELGQYGSSGVDAVLTYRDNAPARGLSYDELLRTIDEYYFIDDLNVLIQKLIANLSADLIAYHIDSHRLEHIKKLFGWLAHKYLDGIENKRLDFFLSMKNNDPGSPGQEILQEIHNLISSLIIGQTSAFRRPSETIRILDKYIPDKNTAALYYRLAFARDNNWTNLICSKLPDSSFQLAVSIGFFPITLGKGKIKALILSSSSGLDEKSVDNILNTLVTDRNWHI